MNILDQSVIFFLNQFSQQSWFVDKLIFLLTESYLLKGGVVLAIIWWAWFKDISQDSITRKYLTATIISSIFAMCLARVLAVILPYRARPMHDSSLEFILPHGMSSNFLEGWSSFPSDHAVLFFALSIGIFQVSRLMGGLVLFYSIFIISIPRIYVGYHFPTDIIGGAFIGILITYVGNKYLIQTKVCKKIVDLAKSKPSYFYPFFFLISFQFASLFDDIRRIGRGFFIAIEELF